MSSLSPFGGPRDPGAEALSQRVAIVPSDANGDRLDRFLAKTLSVSRSEIQRWIAEGRVTVQGRPWTASGRVRGGDRVMVDPPPPAKTEALPDPAVRFSVVFADEDVVVVDKPAGLVVHPARGHQRGTLVNGLLALGLFSPADLEAQGNTRPGIVHRLDKGTSGILVVARTAFARDVLIEQFRCHSVTRAYEAVVVGQARGQTFDTLHGRHPSDRLRFTTRVREGKRAVTHLRVLGRLHGATHVECVLETGRTHQIRVHLADAGTPVLGDAVYGKPPREARVRAVANQISRPALHARLLEFVHPRTRERMTFEASLPPDLLDAIRQLS